MSTYLPGLLRPTREGAQGGAPSTIQAGTCGPMWTVQVPCLRALLALYVKSKVYKAFLDNRRWASHWKDWFPPCLFLLYFLDEFPSGMWRLAMSTYLSQLLRPMREGAQGGAPSTIQMGTSGLT